VEALTGLLTARSERRRVDFGVSRVVGVTFIVKDDEVFYPISISFFCSWAVVFDTNGGADLIDELLLGHGINLHCGLSRKAKSQVLIYLEKLVNVYRSPKGGNYSTRD